MKNPCTPRNHVRLSGTILLFLAVRTMHGQCPLLYDYYGVPSETPIWYSCSGSNFSLQIATPQTVGQFTIDWGDGSPLYTGASLAPPLTVGHVYPATVNEYTVTFTETATECTVIGTLVIEQGSSASLQIPVGGLTQVCAPQEVQFINTSTNVSPNTMFTWDFGDGSPALTLDHTTLGQTISHTYERGTVDCETTVRLTAENTCNALQGGASFATFNPIRIWDIDNATIAPSASVMCWPDNRVTYANTTQRNCFDQGNILQRYEYWNFGDYWGLGHDSIISWTPWPPTFPRSIEYPGIGSYEVMMLDSSFCGIDTAYVTISIVPPPAVTLTAFPDQICAGEVVIFDETTTGDASTFQWDFDLGSGFQVAGQGDQAIVFDAPGVYNVRYAASVGGSTTGCADTAMVVVDVLPSPTAGFTVDNTAACDQLTVTFTNTSVNGISYLWDLGDGTSSSEPVPPPHLYSSYGSYTITLTVMNGQGCRDVATQVVNVFHPPQVQIGAQNVCESVMAQFEDQTVTDAGNPVIEWSWDFGDGGTADVASPAHLYAGSGSYTVTLVANTAYCGGSGTLAVEVSANPVASFLPVDAIGCSPHEVTFTNTSTGGGVASWAFGDGSSSNDASTSYTYTNFGTQDTTYTVRLVMTTDFGCADTLSADITVAPPVRAMFNHDAIPACAPVAVNFTNTSTGAVSYAWDLGDGTTTSQASTSHVYTNQSLFLQVNNVRLVATSIYGCRDTLYQQIPVYPTPDFDFAVDPDSGCSPHIVDLPPVVGAVVYQWDYGDGSTGSGPSPTHIYVNETGAEVTYPLTLIAANAFGCADTTQAQVTVYPTPTAAFTISPGNGCHPLVATLTNTSTGATSNSWNYGDGSTSTTNAPSHVHTWVNNTGSDVMSYPLELTVSTVRGCSSSASAQVQVYPQVTPSFTVDSLVCSPFEVDLVNLSEGAVEYLWDMGDGTTLEGGEPTFTYVNTGTADQDYTIALTATSVYGCSATTSRTITVAPVPVASFEATPTLQQFPNTTVFVVNGTAPGPWTYDWTFGDGASADVAEPGSHTYATWGTYTIGLVVNNGLCSDSVSRTVTITPVPTAAFVGQGAGCAPFTMGFTNNSIQATSYLWEFGDGGTSTADNPIYVYNVPGVYTVTLTAFGIGGSSDTLVKVDSVVVHPRAMAFFTLQPTDVTVPTQPVFAYNLSSNSSIYGWDFGDGSTSAEADPVHYYRTPGIYEVRLIANNQWNCPDTFLHPVPVTARAFGQLEFPNAFSPGSAGPTDGVYDPRSYTNDFFFPMHAGVEEYRLEVFNRWGELVFVSEDVNVGWDGYYRGQPAKQDVYVWKAQARFSDGNETALKGNVTLLR